MLNFTLFFNRFFSFFLDLFVFENSGKRNILIKREEKEEREKKRIKLNRIESNRISVIQKITEILIL